MQNPVDRAFYAARAVQVLSATDNVMTYTELAQAINWDADRYLLKNWQFGDVMAAVHVLYPAAAEKIINYNPGYPSRGERSLTEMRAAV